MKLWLAAITGMVLALPAWSDQVLVSLAQLDNATRLVLTFEKRPTWTTDQSGRTLTLDFQSTGHQIDVADGNAFVAGNRIENLSVPEDGASLALVLACDCRVDVYPFGTSSLVIEVRDAIAIANVQDVTSTAPEQPDFPLAVDETPAIPASDAPPVTARTAKRLANSQVPREVLAEIDHITWEPSSSGLELIETLGFSIRTAEESQAIALLSRQLSRAAAQGLIEPDADPSGRRQIADATGGEPNGLADRSNISVTTSLDRDILASREKLPPTSKGSVCFSDKDVDLANWGDTTDFSTLGRLRRDAAAENGDILPKGALALARYYIALGFGSEAASTANFIEAGEQKRLIEAMAEIVDHGYSDSSILDGQISCQGKVALWAALARPIPRDAVPASTDFVLSTFSALPPHHRAHLGPVLAERLRSVGLESAARNAVNAVARGGLQSNESELVTARLELDGTRPDLARDTLVEISNGTDVAAAEALLELLRDAARREMAPNPAWVEDAPSLSRATEGTGVAAPLNLAGLRGRIALNQFDKVRQALAEDTPGLDKKTRSDLSIATLAQAFNTADNAAFLRAELGMSRFFKVGDMPRHDRFNMARRLTDIGLANRAERYLPPNPSLVDEIAVAAEVLVQTGQSSRAIELLSDRDEAETIRALGQVLSERGQDETAILAFEESGALDEAARAAMRAGNWDWIAKREVAGKSGALSETARALLAQPSAPTDPNDPGNGQLVNSSRELRRRAAELLSETSLSGDQPAFTN